MPSEGGVGPAPGPGRPGNMSEPLPLVNAALDFAWPALTFRPLIRRIPRRKARDRSPPSAAPRSERRDRPPLPRSARSRSESARSLAPSPQRSARSRSERRDRPSPHRSARSAKPSRAEPVPNAAPKRPLAKPSRAEPQRRTEAPARAASGAWGKPHPNSLRMRGAARAAPTNKTSNCWVRRTPAITAVPKCRG